jgi:hypothetical protein
MEDATSPKGAAQHSERDLAFYVRSYDDALPAELCDRIVARFEADMAGRKSVDVAGIRRFDVLNLTKSPAWEDVHRLLYARIQSELKRYVEDCRTRWIPTSQAYENFRIKRYRPGKGEEFGPHVDISGAAMATRMIAVLWYLNDVEAGGETEFLSLGLSIRPRKGRVLVFPPTFLYPHAGRPPRSGVKYIVGSYAHYV